MKSKGKYCEFKEVRPDRRVAQLVAVFICHSNAIQNFPEKNQTENGEMKGNQTVSH